MNFETLATNVIEKSDHSSSTITLLNNGTKRIDQNNDNENSIPSKDSSSSSSTTIVNTQQQQQQQSSITNEEMLNLKVKDFNDVITCFLCKGYLIDATTINECLHSFCKTCILKYFDDDNNPKSRSCPKCDTQVHKTKPKLNIRSDPTRQDIVYKLVPGLYKSEMNRRKEFYRRHPDKAIGLSNEEKGEINGERLILSNDDQIQITIEYFPEVSNPFPLLPFNNDENSNITKLTNLNQRRYLLVKSGMRVLHLKKFIQYKYELDPSIQVDFFFKHERLKDDYTIMDVAYIYSWRRNIPIPLYYLILEPNKTHDDYIWLNNEPKITPLSVGRQQSLRQTRLQMRRMSNLHNNSLNRNLRRMRSNSTNDLLVSSSFNTSDTKSVNNVQENCTNSSNQNNRRNSTSKFAPKTASTPLSMKSTNNSESNVDKKDDKIVANKRSLVENGSPDIQLASKKIKYEFNNILTVNSVPITATKISNPPIVSDSEIKTATTEEIKNGEIKKQQQQQQISSVTIPLCSDSQNSFTSSSAITLKIDENHKLSLSKGNDTTKPKRHDSISSTSSSSSSSSSSRSSSPMTLLDKIIKKVEERNLQQVSNSSTLSPVTNPDPSIDENNDKIEKNDDNNKSLETVMKHQSEEALDQLPSLIPANSIAAIDLKQNQNSNQTSSSNGDGLVFSTLITMNSQQNSPTSCSLKIDNILESLASIVETDKIAEHKASSSPSNNNLHINVLNGNNNCDTGNNGGNSNSSMDDFQQFQKLLYEQINKATSNTSTTKSIDTTTINNNNSNGTAKNHHSLESSSSS
ncbi:ring finger containing protein [Dermatophagoides farinae]|uniref:Ring finger containing protein n=1 Tax=Dermatophagoides farinae TaxID=6954 RepID=A0A9D4SEC0_DERFA|nr:ring finger containing protein [Dermatophagoides farinae]